MNYHCFPITGSFADHVRCQFDYLTIRQDGPRGRNLGKYCGSKKPSPIASDSNILWINMITDKIDTFAGFRAGWETIDSAPEGKSYSLIVSHNCLFLFLFKVRIRVRNSGMQSCGKYLE